MKIEKNTQIIYSIIYNEKIKIKEHLDSQKEHCQTLVMASSTREARKKLLQYLKNDWIRKNYYHASIQEISCVRKTILK